MRAEEAQANSTLLAMKMRELQQCAEHLRVSREDLDEADDSKERTYSTEEVSLSCHSSYSRYIIIERTIHRSSCREADCGSPKN